MTSCLILRANFISHWIRSTARASMGSITLSSRRHRTRGVCHCNLCTSQTITIITHLEASSARARMSHHPCERDYSNKASTILPNPRTQTWYLIGAPTIRSCKIRDPVLIGSFSTTTLSSHMLILSCHSASITIGREIAFTTRYSSWTWAQMIPHNLCNCQMEV